jgi:hypothetical protein
MLARGSKEPAAGTGSWQLAGPTLDVDLSETPCRRLPAFCFLLDLSRWDG